MYLGGMTCGRSSVNSLGYSSIDSGCRSLTTFFSGRRILARIALNALRAFPVISASEVSAWQSRYSISLGGGALTFVSAVQMIPVIIWAADRPSVGSPMATISRSKRRSHSADCVTAGFPRGNSQEPDVMKVAMWDSVFASLT
jgi:hypothetical protein